MLKKYFINSFKIKSIKRLWSPFVFIFLLIIISCNLGGGKKDAKLMNGDIIFQTSTSRQSKAIQLATDSKYTHMGIIYFRDNKPYVFEAVQPVKLTPLGEWINRGLDRHYVVKRLKNAEKILSDKILKKMKEIGERFEGKDYDIYFEWSDDRIYCSELVWKIYKEATGIEIGKLQKLEDFNLSSEAVKQKLQERFGENIPMDEVVISPDKMFHDKKIILVKKTY